MRQLRALCICLLAGTAISTTALAGSPEPKYVNGFGSNFSEANYVVLQFPPTINVLTGTPTGNVYGQIYQAGSTEANGPNANIVAQFGYGPFGSDPLVNDAGWTWFSTSYNVQVGNNDEYLRSITAPAPGTYAYTYRFDLVPAFAAANIGWTLADLDGAGTNPGLSYNPANLGVLTVTPAPGAAALLGLGGLIATRRRR